MADLNSGGKMTSIEYVRHEHSLLALFITPEEIAPGATGDAGGNSLCDVCCLPLQDLNRRQRLWFFVFLFSSSMIASAEVELGIEGPIESFLTSVFIVLPIAMLAKSNINRLDGFQPIGGIIKPMELGLLIYICYALYGIMDKASDGELGKYLVKAISSWITTMIQEAVMLMFFFHCCGCFCVPSTNERKRQPQQPMPPVTTTQQVQPPHMGLQENNVNTTVSSSAPYMTNPYANPAPTSNKLLSTAAMTYTSEAVFDDVDD